MVARNTKFETLTDGIWEVALRRARGYSNSVSTQIKMKLHPCNPTPGYAPKPRIHMIKFEPLTTTKGVEPNVKVSQSFACVQEGRALGYLHPDNTGIYNFFPNHLFGMNWSSNVLKEVAFKMDALNLPQAIEATD
jgi:hypothetical protein